ncbi:phosphatidylinositol mannoside acyltransferase [Sanguibacter antarcticus]|uniref:KDO2-lipid IV(A) lauroyltransferase n=1 Tax=Sanguibacter antarcticus TaxID=372484 RepID=A0A2A9E4F0_9MICO|nr:phosphatidylinositol mannoside acyltransferase [Sanguibacter antarcticus]PFG33059.1 KDO2-lipid IV(A) lauroyltransferase [Sanguibacter antarcticus]
MIDSARAFHLAWRHVGTLPPVIVRGLFSVVADVASLSRRGGVDQLRRNLRRARPEASAREIRTLARRGMRSYMRYYREVFVLQRTSEAQIAARVRVDGLENCTRFTDAGVSPVVALTHQGNWDLAGVYASRHIAPVLTVAERLEPPALYEEFKAFREGLGMEILTAGDGDVFRRLMREARSPAPARLICLLADRDLSHNGIEARLFDAQVRVATGPAALAVACGAPLVGANIVYERLTGARRRAAGSPWGIVITFHPAVDVPTAGTKGERMQAATQGWVDAVSPGLAEHPEDWHMLQKVFVDDLDPVRLAHTNQRTDTPWHSEA